MTINESSFHKPDTRSRRNFLGLTAAGVVSASGAAFALTRGDVEMPSIGAVDANSSSGPTTTTNPLRASADLAGRTLVVVELAGGNDGLATLVPRNAGALYDQRPAVHIPDEELIDFTDDFGWTPAFERLSGHGLAALVGVGTTVDPDGSHFEMERRWWAGQSSGTDMPSTGFLGRLCDQLHVGQPVTGLSIGSGATPALLADKAITMGLSDPGSGWFLETEDPWFANMRSGLADLARPDNSIRDEVLAARTGLTDTLAFAETLAKLDTDRVREKYPGSGLGWQFGLASELIQQESDIRVLHLSHGGFDTHTDQRGDHEYLMTELSEAMSVFLEDLGDQGFSESTLVCTTSEFGRRVTDNDGGTDHGAASMALLAGPVEAGIHGEMPSLSKLDDGNLEATVDFADYYATLAEYWFGVPASEVLNTAAAPVDGVITI